MRKVIMFNMVTLDGFFEGPKGPGDIDWHRTDEEFDRFAVDQLDTAGGIIFGRVTYEMMATYWPTPEAIRGDPQVAGRMNRLPKYVFSRTHDRAAEWENSTLLKGDVTAEINRLKQQPGQDLLLFGSADLASTLTRLGLIDEYRVLVNPVVLGRGRPLFQDPPETLNLKLVQSRTFGNGNVLLTYQPER